MKSNFLCDTGVALWWQAAATLISSSGIAAAPFCFTDLIHVHVSRTHVMHIMVPSPLREHFVSSVTQSLARIGTPRNGCPKLASYLAEVSALPANVIYFLFEFCPAHESTLDSRNRAQTKQTLKEQIAVNILLLKVLWGNNSRLAALHSWGPIHLSPAALALPLAPGHVPVRIDIEEIPLYTKQRTTTALHNSCCKATGMCWHQDRQDPSEDFGVKCKSTQLGNPAAASCPP